MHSTGGAEGSAHVSLPPPMRWPSGTVHGAPRGTDFFCKEKKNVLKYLFAVLNHLINVQCVRIFLFLFVFSFSFFAMDPPETILEI